MRRYVQKNNQVDFSGRTSSSTAVLEHRCPRGEGSPIRELILKKTSSNSKSRWRSKNGLYCHSPTQVCVGRTEFGLRGESIRVHPEIPDGHACSFQIGNEGFCSRPRKSKACAETYWSTSHKQGRRLTQRLGKRTISGWKLIKELIVRFTRRILFMAFF
jgi:hypothetical protein